MRSSKFTLFAALLLTISSAEGQYRNYSLRCLAPLLENIDPNAPQTLQEAFLSGPQQFAIPLEGIGAEAIDFPISTESKEAQQFFEQGIALLHVLWYKEAERAFRMVVELDPDCPMGYWGLAQTCERTPQRARIFATAAADRCDRNRPDIEQKWTALLTEFYSDTDEELSNRSARRIRALEELTLDFPDHREARAFLIRRLTLDPFIAGLPVTSTLGTDALAKEFASEIPEHPSRHYRIFLWLDRRPEQLLDEAAGMTRYSPRAAEIWRYASEAHLAAGRLSEAALLGETALLVDHQNLEARNRMPWEAQNLKANQEALVYLLAHSGRIDEALALAKRALLLPQNLTSNQAGAERLWVNVRMISGEWEALLKDLKTDPLLRASDRMSSRASRLAWTGIALLALGRSEETKPIADQLAQLEKEALIAGVSSFDESAIAESRQMLEAAQNLFSNGAANALESIALPSLAKARLLELSGKRGKAFQLIEAEIKTLPYRWLPTAYYCRLAMKTGRQRDALFAIDRRFRMDANRADSDLPLLTDLAVLAGQLRLGKDWMLPAPETDFLKLSDAVGPEIWKAPKAPDFELKDRLGETWTLKQFSGRPVLLNFFLGVNCPFCLQQFEAFSSYLPAYSASGIEVLAVSIDSTENLKQVLGEGAEVAPALLERFPFPVLSDPELNVFKNYSVFDEFESGPMHATILISPEGNILWQNIGHAPFQKPAILLEEASRLLKSHEAFSMP